MYEKYRKLVNRLFCPIVCFVFCEKIEVSMELIDLSYFRSYQEIVIVLFTFRIRYEIKISLKLLVGAFKRNYFCIQW